MSMWSGPWSLSSLEMSSGNSLRRIHNSICQLRFPRDTHQTSPDRISNMSEYLFAFKRIYQSPDLDLACRGSIRQVNKQRNWWTLGEFEAARFGPKLRNFRKSVVISTQNWGFNPIFHHKCVQYVVNPWLTKKTKITCLDQNNGWEKLKNDSRLDASSAFPSCDSDDCLGKLGL
jgi:hypothetical protein